jgi:hypothetical protein
MDGILVRDETFHGRKVIAGLGLLSWNLAERAIRHYLYTIESWRFSSDQQMGNGEWMMVNWVSIYDAPQKLDRHLRCKIAAQRSSNEEATTQNL